MTSLVTGLLVGATLLVMLMLTLFCVEAARHPWWSRLPPAQGGG